MLEVHTKFKKAIREYGRQIALRICFNNQEIESHKIRSFSKKFNAEMFRCCMQVIHVELAGNYDVKGQEVTVSFGAKTYRDSEYTYVSWGTFLVDNESITYHVETNTTTFTAYDRFIQAHVDYQLDTLVYPITVKEYLKAICEKLNIRYQEQDFTNQNQVLYEEKFLPIPNATYRDALDAIAGVAGGIIIMSNDVLCIRYPTQTGEVISENTMRSFSIGEKWGEIKSIALSREPQEDNIIYPEDATEDRGMVRIANNQIMDRNREDYIVPIYERIKGVSLYPFKVVTAYGYFEPYDCIILKDIEGNMYHSIIMNSVISITSGIVEELQTTVPEVAKTDYAKATGIGKKLLNVQLYVDKQNGEIQGEIIETNRKVASLDERQSVLEMDLDSISTSVSKTQERIDTIQLGTRNYFSVYHARADDNYHAFSIDKDIFKMTFTMQHGSQYLAFGSSNYQLVPNTFYTLSGKITINNQPITKAFFTDVRMHSYTSVDARNFVKVDDKGNFVAVNYYDVTNNWFVHTSVNTKAGDIVSIENFQIEKGNIVSDFVPAPEDIDSQMIGTRAEMVSLIKQTAENITSTVKETQEEVSLINTTLYSVRLLKTGSLLDATNTTITLEAKVYLKNEEVTTKQPAIAFQWYRISNDTEADTIWNRAHQAMKFVNITSVDVDTSANFSCVITLPNMTLDTGYETIIDHQDVAMLSNSYLDVTGVPMIQALQTDGTYSPNFTQTNAVITPVITDGIVPVTLQDCSITYKRVVEGQEQALLSDEVVRDGILSVRENVMTKIRPSITYVCYVQYRNASIKLFITLALTIVGEKGSTGATGKGLKTMTSYFSINTSTTVAPTTGWVVVQPTRLVGQILWRKEITTYTDNTTSETAAYVVSGDAGIGIEKVDVQYYLSTSHTTQSDGSWSTLAPAWIDGRYMWSKTITYLSNGTSIESKAVCITGAKGQTGSTGQGVVSITEEYYVSTSKEKVTGGAWVEKPPTWSTGKYIWTRSKIVYSNPTTTVYTAQVCDSSWEAVNEIAVGSRNLVKLSNKSWNNTSYNICTVDLSSELVVGETYTVQVKGTCTGGTVGMWLNGGSQTVTTNMIKNPKTNAYTYTFVCPTKSNSTYNFAKVGFYNYPSTQTPKMNEIEWVKIERGNVATDWSAAPEDVYDSLSQVQETITQQFESNIEQLQKEIKASVQSVTEQVGIQSASLTELTNSMQLTNEATSFIKTTMQTLQNIVTGKVDQSKVLEWARFDGSTLELGASNSQFSAKLTNTQLGFYQGSNKIAWISNNELYILNAAIQESLKIGTFIMHYNSSLGFTIM